MTVGVVTRFAKHAEEFPLAYYEVKGVNGVWHRPVGSAIPMISVFGDHRVAQAHPEWVQVGPHGKKATADREYFDWDHLCPSHEAVFELGLKWIHQAYEESQCPVIRLDDVAFAREGYCQCAACREAEQASGLDALEYRQRRLEDFVRQAAEIGPRLELTLYPDPYPLHLEQRFGLSPDRLAVYVDRFVVPIYDQHYATTYWLEILASAFRDRLPRPFLIELYGLQVPEEALLRAAQVAHAYADGVLIAYDNQVEKLRRIQHHLTNGR
ncbi:MAG: hypothetical protein OWU33_09935 [Firmicutes bacterium]|nr:hypothetical protein [Bacillota bacterium]